MAVAYDTQVVIYDLETKKQLVRFECDGIGGVNKLVCHPTLSLTITAHEDRHIRFWDNSTGKMLHAMVAHLDAVTSLSLDPNGLYLLSGSKLIDFLGLWFCNKRYSLHNVVVYCLIAMTFWLQNLGDVILDKNVLYAKFFQVMIQVYVCGTWNLNNVCKR